MEENAKGDKVVRVLQLYAKLMDGCVVNKTEEARFYGVNERSIQRDIDDIRNFLDADADRTGVIHTVAYDREKKGYRLDTMYRMSLTNSEVLALCKILLDSRAFTKQEMVGMLDKLITSCVPKSNQKLVQDLIRNEEFHYVEPRHRTKFIDTMWEIGQAIRSKCYVELEYFRTKDKQTVKRRVKPVAVMFSEYYFYMTAFIDRPDDLREKTETFGQLSPTIYRIDRIQKLKVLKERFHMLYSSRFEEGEFRKRIQFMYGGELKKVRFRYLGPDIDAVLDRLPTAQVLDEADGVYTVEAEVFGKGIDMWLRSQGEYVKVE